MSASDVPWPAAPRAWAALPPFWPYAARLVRLSHEPVWPEVGAYRALLGADVDFAVSDPRDGRLRAGLDASDIEGSYVARCRDGVVPTRRHNLHDLMGALTWAVFPRTKRALVQRQIEVAVGRGPVTNRLRTPFQDRLAMLDEGGVFTLEDGTVVTFGHALLEDACRGRGSRGVPVPATGEDDAALLAALELYLAGSSNDPALLAASVSPPGHSSA